VGNDRGSGVPAFLPAAACSSSSGSGIALCRYGVTGWPVSAARPQSEAAGGRLSEPARRLQQTNTPLPRGWLPWFSVPPGRDGTGRMVPEFTSNAIWERLLAGE